MLLLLKHILFKILTKFGFKKIWLEKHGKFIQLWGEFNPKVLLMEEELLEIKNRRLDNKLIGEKLDNGGVVVSDSFAKDFMEGKSSKTLDDLQSMDAEDIRKLSGNVATKEFSGSPCNTKRIRENLQ